MFGNPFTKFPSAVQFPNEKCRWCLQRIGMDGRYPIPVCGACFGLALINNTPGSPKGNLWERLMTEFSTEARAWVKRMRTTPTALDMMEATSSASAEIAELRLHAQRLRLGGDVQLANAMETRLKEMTEEITKFKSSMPALVGDLDKEL